MNSDGSFRVGDVVSQTIDVIRRSLGRFVGIAAAFSIVILLANQAAVESLPGGLILSLAVQVSLSPIMAAMMTYLVFQVMLAKHVAIQESIAVATRRFRYVLGVSIVPALIMGVVIVVGVGVLGYAGLAAALVGATMLAVMWSIAVPIAVVEQLGVAASLRRSAELTRGLRWRALGVLLIFSLPAVAAQLVGFFGGASTESANTLLPALGGLVASIFVMVLGSAYPAMLYFHVRRAKESVDIDEIASALDQ
jgi:hypothetical protein